MKRIWITDAGAVTSLGNDLETVWQALARGQKGITDVDRFSTDNYNARTAALIPGLCPMPLPDPAIFGTSGSRGAGGALSLQGDAGAAKSRMVDLLDRLLEGFGPVPGDARLITATTKGAVDILEGICRDNGGGAHALPLSAFSRMTAKRLALGDAGMNISAACASSTIAVGRGAAMIASGRADAVLVCCADLVTEFVFSGFSALGALSPDGARPFDRERNGLMLGEGAAALLLMEEGRAKKEGRRCLGLVAGWGEASDAAHVTAPARDGRGLIRAIGRAMERAGAVPVEMAGICAHGTGTVYNDMMELTAFDAVFKDKKLPVTSVKGALGHTLGAAGGIEAALCIRALHERFLPPTAGLQRPEEKGEGRVSSLPLPIEGRYLLSTNSGFGGINAALILEKGGDQWPL